jgi:hypothetical protein
LTGGYSFWVIPASHHPRVVCLSACASGYTCENVHARGRQPPLPSHLLRFPISSTTSPVRLASEGHTEPYIPTGHHSRRDNIFVRRSACRQTTIYLVRFWLLATLFAAVGLAIECSGNMELLRPLCEEHLSLTMASSSPETISTRPVGCKRTSTFHGSLLFTDNPLWNRMDY